MSPYRTNDIHFERRDRRVIGRNKRKEMRENARRILWDNRMAIIAPILFYLGLAVITTILWIISAYFL